MKIVIPGGSGYVGTVLARAFHQQGEEVVVLSRTPASRPWRTVAWDGEILGDWVAEFESADAIINLAGQSVNCRYTNENRRIITESRLKSTDRKSTRLNSSHGYISYAVFCLKKKTKIMRYITR